MTTQRTAPTSTSLHDLLETADDAAFARALPRLLDVDAFATYLALQEIVDAYDGPSRPGDHAYVCYDTSTGSMAVVDWTLDVSVGTRHGFGDAAAARTLAQRFLTQPAFAALVDAELERLTRALVDSGAAESTVGTAVAVLRRHTERLRAADLPPEMRAPGAA